mmetsp:Transcript_2723/g.7588  ORF Transcript_2723/g.7588 Transcript_2723/m.7588 type:complete len:112 (-) Transcript_2723:1035-1370(-)
MMNASPLLCLTALAATSPSVLAFQPSHLSSDSVGRVLRWTRPNARVLTALSSSSESIVRDTRTDKTNFAGREGAGDMLRNLEVTNVDGKKEVLGNAMGDGKSLVIFLRHLG